MQIDKWSTGKQANKSKNKHLKRVARFLCLMLLIGGAVFAAGCDGSGSGEKAGENRIRYSSMWREGEPQATWLRETADAFTEKTGIEVDIDFKGREVLTKEKGNLIMGTPPDIIDQDINELMAAMLTKDIKAMPLDDVFHGPGPEGQAKLGTIFSDRLLKLYQKGGKNYFVPYEFITTLFICDKKKIQSYGGFPTTWDAFISLGKRLSSDGIPPLALDGTIYGYNAYYYCYLVERIMGPGYLEKAALDESGASFDHPGFLNAARLVSDISKSRLDFFQSGYEHSNYPQAQGYWAKGGAASILCGSWIPVETSTLVREGFEYGYYAFPSVEGGEGKAGDLEAILIGGMIPKDAKNPDAAKELLKFMSGKKHAQRFAENTMSISARTDVAYPKVLKDMEPIVKNATAFVKPYDGLLSSASEWFANVFHPLDNDLLFGRITPEQFIKQLKQKSVEFYKDNN